MKRLILSLLLLAPALAEAQQTRRPYVALVFGTHVEDADNVTGRAPAIGIVAGARLTSSWSVEVEAGRPTQIFAREHAGIGTSFAPPGSSLAEIERLGVLERFRKERDVRATVSVGAVFQPRVHPRWHPRLFMGVTNHHVRERFATTILRLPDGVDADKLRSVRPMDERHTRNLGGPSFGGGVGVVVTEHLSIAPEVRYDYGSIGDEINNTFRASVRTFWWF